MNKSTESKTGIAGEGYVDVFIGSLCSPKSTYHRDRLSTTKWTAWFFHQHQPALLSATLVPGGTQGSRNLGAVTTTVLLWASQVSQAAGKERNYCIWGAFSPDQHTSRISSCSVLSHWPDPSWGKGDFLHRIWLKGTSRDRLTYPRNLCLNYNYKLGDMPEMTWRLGKSKGCG